jgi:hypothetical protein
VIFKSNFKQAINLGFDAGIYVYAGQTLKKIVVTNFSENQCNFELKSPDVITKWNLKDGEYAITDQFIIERNSVRSEQWRGGRVQVEIGPSESFIYQL